MGEREHARDDRLGGDDGGQRGQADQGEQRPVRHQMVERMGERCRLVQDQSALAEIIEDQSRQDQAEPGPLDRRPAEMAHVGIERLGAGHRQHDRAQRHEGLPAGQLEQADGVARIQGAQHPGMLHDLDQAQDGQGGEPDQHDRPEQLADAGRAAALQHEQKEQDDHRQGHDMGLQSRGRGLQAFDRREHRDRRGDQAVAIEQGEPGQRQGQDHFLQAGAPRGWLGSKRAERQDAALAAIVGAQDQGDIFEADDQAERPEDQREHAQHRQLAQGQAAGFAKGFADGVERAGADIAIDHAQRRQRQRGGGRGRGSYLVDCGVGCRHERPPRDRRAGLGGCSVQLSGGPRPMSSPGAARSYSKAPDGSAI